jgi:hypothetical protein
MSSVSIFRLSFGLSTTLASRKCLLLQRGHESGFRVVTIVDSFFDSSAGNHTAFRILLGRRHQ